MNTQSELTNRLLPDSYKEVYPCLKSRNLLRFCLLLVIFAGFLPISAGQSGANRDTEMGNEFVAQAGAKIFAQRLSETSNEPLPTPERPDKVSWKGLSLHEAFIDRMADVHYNLLGIQGIHRHEQGLGNKPNFQMEMLPEVRVFADVMAEQGAESEIYDSLITISAMVADEERGKLGYQIEQEELDRRPDLVEQGLKHGDWIRKPAQYEKVSQAFETMLNKLEVAPNLRDQIEKIVQDRFIPIVDEMTIDSMSLGGTIRHFSDNEEFKDIENLQGKLSAFAKIAYLATVNEWAEQNGLPELDLSKHLPEEYLVTSKIAGKVPSDQLQFARETVAGISPDRQEAIDKSAIFGEKSEEQKELAKVNSR